MKTYTSPDLHLGIVPKNPSVVTATGAVQQNTLNHPHALIRFLDTKHDFEQFFNIEHLQSHYVNDIQHHVNKGKWTTTMKVGANTLHKLIDFTTDIVSEENFIIGQPGVFAYTVTTPQILPTVKLANLANKTTREQYLQSINPTRDTLLYLQGTKKDISVHTSVLQEIMSIGKDTDTYVSKDAFPIDTGQIKTIFKYDKEDLFKSFTSQILDPATENKKIVALEKYTFELVFCYFNKIPIYITIAAGIGHDLLTLAFKYNGKLSGKYSFKKNTKTPSISDVLIFIFENTDRGTKALGAKFKKFLKSEKTNSNSLASLYFEPIQKLIQSIIFPSSNPPVVSVSKEFVEIVALASKTIGDQMYLYDAVLSDCIKQKAPNNIHGSFVVSIDTFLNDYIIHTKSANLFSASKYGKKIPGMSSNYEICIYLKPLSIDAAKEFREGQEKMSEIRMLRINILLEKITASRITILIHEYKTKYDKYVKYCSTLFNNFAAVSEARTNDMFFLSKYEKDSSSSDAKKEYSSSEVSQLYYKAVYHLHAIIQFYNLLLTKKDKIPTIDKNIPSGGDNKIIVSTLHDLEQLSLILEDADSYLKVDSLLPYSGKTDKQDLDSMRNSLNKNVAVINKTAVTAGSIRVPYTIPLNTCFGKVKAQVVSYFGDYQVSGTLKGGVKSGSKSLPFKIEDHVIISADENVLNELFDLYFFFNYQNTPDGNNTDTHYAFYDYLYDMEKIRHNGTKKRHYLEDEDVIINAYGTPPSNDENKMDIDKPNIAQTNPNKRPKKTKKSNSNGGRRRTTKKRRVKNVRDRKV